MRVTWNKVLKAMIIKRKPLLKDSNKIDDQASELLFSDIDRANAVSEIYGDSNPQSRRVMLEIMKVIEMYYAFPDDTKNLQHWIGKAAGAVMNIQNDKYFPGQAVFSTTDWTRNGESVLGNNVMSEIKNKYRDPENFITEFVMGMLLTEKNAGEVKYGNIIKTKADIKTSPKDYLLYYKYIALCLSGQMNPETQDFSSNIREITGGQVDYGRDMKFNKYDVCRIIKQCIINIMHYESPALSRYFN